MSFDEPILWFINRASGLVLLVLLTLSLVWGINATSRNAGGYVPSFFSQNVHRHVSLATAVFMVAHGVSAVVDEYVEISWWDLFAPISDSYKPPYLGLGALALDLILVVVVTSLFKDRLRANWWRVIHWTTYLVWPIAVIHGIGIGTDRPNEVRWVFMLYVVCAFVVLASIVLRLISAVSRARDRQSA